MSASTAKIRNATPADVHTLASFNIAMAMETEKLRLDPYVVERGVAAVVTDPTKGTYFVAEVDGAVVGGLMITHEWSDWRNGDIWWVQSVYVRPDYRKRGIFTELYRSAEAASKQAGAVAIRLYVDVHNEIAQATYKRLGLKMTEYRVMDTTGGD